MGNGTTDHGEGLGRSTLQQVKLPYRRRFAPRVDQLGRHMLVAGFGQDVPISELHTLLCPHRAHVTENRDKQRDVYAHIANFNNRYKGELVIEVGVARRTYRIRRANG